MKGRLACTFVALLAIGAAQAREPKCTLRAHVQANANDGEVFSTNFRSPVTGRDIVIEKMATISERDVVAFRAYPAAGDGCGVLFQLNDHGRITLDALSIEHRGTLLYVFVNGRPAAELQIDRHVADGQLYVAAGLTAADVEMMKKQWPIIGAQKKRR